LWAAESQRMHTVIARAEHRRSPLRTHLAWRDFPACHISERPVKDGPNVKWLLNRKAHLGAVDDGYGRTFHHKNIWHGSPSRSSTLRDRLESSDYSERQGQCLPGVVSVALGTRDLHSDFSSFSLNRNEKNARLSTKGYVDHHEEIHPFHMSPAI
jgi:hypothetical protein